MTRRLLTSSCASTSLSIASAVTHRLCILHHLFHFLLVFHWQGSSVSPTHLLCVFHHLLHIILELFSNRRCSISSKPSSIWSIGMTEPTLIAKLTRTCVLHIAAWLWLNGSRRFAAAHLCSSHLLWRIGECTESLSRWGLLLLLCIEIWWLTESAFSGRRLLSSTLATRSKWLRSCHFSKWLLVRLWCLMLLHLVISLWCLTWCRSSTWKETCLSPSSGLLSKTCCLCPSGLWTETCSKSCSKTLSCSRSRLSESHSWRISLLTQCWAKARTKSTWCRLVAAVVVIISFWLLWVVVIMLLLLPFVSTILVSATFLLWLIFLVISSSSESLAKCRCCLSLLGWSLLFASIGSKSCVSSSTSSSEAWSERILLLLLRLWSIVV